MPGKAETPKWHSTGTQTTLVAHGHGHGHGKGMAHVAGLQIKDIHTRTTDGALTRIRTDTHSKCTLRVQYRHGFACFVRQI